MHAPDMEDSMDDCIRLKSVCNMLDLEQSLLQSLAGQSIDRCSSDLLTISLSILTKCNISS